MCIRDRSSIDAWVDVANGFHYVEIIDFFKNFLLKESAMILLKDMGDELVYGLSLIHIFVSSYSWGT